MKTLLKCSLLLVACAVSTGNMFAEESYSKYLVQERLMPAEETVANTSERFSKLLEKQPTAAGQQQDQERDASAPASRVLNSPQQQDPIDINRGDTEQ